MHPQNTQHHEGRLSNFSGRYPQVAVVVTVCFSITVLTLIIQAFLGEIILLHRTGWLRFIPNTDYYTVLTAHGITALALSFFAVCGIYSWAIVDSLETKLRIRFVRLWLALLILGTTLTEGLLVVDGMFGVEASVLYTFYAPLEAHPFFYIGLAMLIGGTWVAGATWLDAWYRWRLTHSSERLPLKAFIVVVTVLLWYLSSIGITVQALFMIIPWSFGFIGPPDALVSRSLFWTMGQSLGYFWLLAIYLVLYTVLPHVAKGRLFSDPLARSSCLLILVAGPAFGFHHQYTDPGISSTMKYIAFLKMLVLVLASLITMFTVIASVEYSPRSRGVKGWFRWLRYLPWRSPDFASIMLGGMSLAIGALSGVLNANPYLNYRVHNTLWIVGHFHLMIVGGMVMVFLGAIYWLLPVVSGWRLRYPEFASFISYLWFINVVVMSAAMHLLGLAGVPRRTAELNFGLLNGSIIGNPELLQTVMAVAGVGMIVAVVGVTAVFTATVTSSIGYSGTHPQEPALVGRDDGPALLYNIPVWTGISALLVIMTYVFILSVTMA